jgi:hypothetical protein
VAFPAVQPAAWHAHPAATAETAVRLKTTARAARPAGAGWLARDWLRLTSGYIGYTEIRRSRSDGQHVAIIDVRQFQGSNGRVTSVRESPADSGLYLRQSLLLHTIRVFNWFLAFSWSARICATDLQTRVT